MNENNINESIVRGAKPKFEAKLIHRFFDEIVDEHANSVALIGWLSQ